ncbi:histone-like nucleoid-structuring protein Lsr2 [Tessaracoccus sp.]
MATQITETLIDDIDGGTATVTAQFSYEGTSYEIDLNKKNAKKLDEAILPFIAAARQVKGSNRAPVKKGSDPVLLAAVRVWAAENGLTTSARGRVAQTVMDAYKAAH